MEYSSSVVRNGWGPGNIGTPVILMTWDPGNTGTPTILNIWGPGNMIKSYVLPVGHAAGDFLFPKIYAFLDFGDMLNLKKLHFCSDLVFVSIN